MPFTIPADNPYAAAFEAWNALPREQTSCLLAACPFPDTPRQGNPEPLAFSQVAAFDETVIAIQTLTHALRAGAVAHDVDWGVDLEGDLLRIVPAGMTTLRSFGRIALARAGHLLRSDPQSALTLAADTLALARHAGADNNILVTRLVQNVIDGMALPVDCPPSS